MYPPTIKDFVSSERLARFFVIEPETGFYRIRKIIREMIIFSEQNVIKDPPFSRLDLIVCRNLLIYIAIELQKKIFNQFHYALNPGGFLFLGSAESIGEFNHLFLTIDRKFKFYQRIEGTLKKQIFPTIGFNSSLPTQHPSVSSETFHGKTKMNPLNIEKKLPLRDLMEKALLLQYAPPSAIVNERSEILYLYGKTGLYLEPSHGEASMNILKMTKEGLRRDLTAALQKSMLNKESVCVKEIKFRDHD